MINRYDYGMRFDQINKLYISHFFTGLVFWYGIEKLFMTSIGIDSLGVGIAFAVLMSVSLLLDIPLGILADAWSRRGVLCVSAVSLGVSSLILGLSSSFAVYVFGCVVYGIYLASSNGTFQSLIYDTLHNQQRKDEYVRVNGRMYATFLIGAAVGNIASGFIANAWGFRATFLLTVASCVANLVIILGLQDPRYHTPEGKPHIVSQFGTVLQVLSKDRLVRSLAIIVTSFMAVRTYIDEFGMLYMVRYVQDERVIGLLWAAFALFAALGSSLAHRWHARFNHMLLFATLPLIGMSLLDSSVSLVLFMVVVTFYFALMIHADGAIQHNTPSHVRTAVSSVLTACGGIMAVISGLVLGYATRAHSILTGLYMVTGLATVVLLWWLCISLRHKWSAALAE